MLPGHQTLLIFSLRRGHGRVGPVRPSDVSPSQQARHDELIRRLTGPERGALICGLWAAGRQLAEAGTRARNPGASERLLRWLLTATIYDEATALRLHGPRPSE